MKTDLSKVLQIPDINENNFTDILNSFNEQFKDYTFKMSQNENQNLDEDIFKSDSKNQNENIKEPQSNSNSKTVEILDNGSVEIKNNDYIEINENEIKLFNFDNELDNKQNNKEILNSNDNINNIRINNYNISNNNNLNLINNKYKYLEKPLYNNNEIPKKYQKTDISKILKTTENNIFQENFKQMIQYVFDKLNPNSYINNSNSANVRLNLNSSCKKNQNPPMYTIREEDNESYDSLSLHKSIRSSAKATPNLIDLKKKSTNDIQDINISNNLFKSFSKEKINSNNDINDNILKEENNLENNNNIINNIINPEKKEDKIKIIYLNPDLENKKNNKNYTTPESKEKTIEKIYEKVKDINEEKNKNSESKEFPKFENEDVNFSDFNPLLNEEEKKEKKDDKNIIIFNNNINNIKNNNNIEPNKQIKINKNKKEKHKLSLDKLYEKFVKKLKNKLPLVDKNIILQKKEMNNSKINNDINIIKNKIKDLKECYLNLIIKTEKLKQKNDLIKLNQDIDLSKKEKEIEQIFDNLLSTLNIKEKEKDDIFYVIKIKNILEKFKDIKTQEISEAKNKQKRNESYLPKYKKENLIETIKIKKECDYKGFYSIIIPIIIVFNFLIKFNKIDK